MEIGDWTLLVKKYYSKIPIELYVSNFHLKYDRVVVSCHGFCSFLVVFVIAIDVAGEFQVILTVVTPKSRER